MKPLNKIAVMLQETGPSKSEMSTLSGMVKQYLEKIEALENTLKDATKIKTEMNNLRLVTIPEYALNVAKQSQFALDTGELVEIIEELKTSISAKNEAIAHNFIKNAGSGSIIKKTIVLSFDTSDEGQEEFKEVQDQLINDQRIFEVKQSIQWQRLNTFVKTQREKQTDFDGSGINIFDSKGTKVDGVKIPKF